MLVRDDVYAETLPAILGINHWIIIVILWVFLSLVMGWFEKIGR
jgi:hypothetical protein